MRLLAGIVCLLLLALTVSSLTWTIEEKIGSPQTRGDNCAAIVNEKIYVIGGRAQRQGDTVIRNQPVEVYDIATRTWTNLGDMDFEVHHGGCVTIGTDIWVVGSYFGRFPNEVTHDVIHVFDTVTETWGTRSYLPNNTARRRAAAAVAVHNGLILLSHGSKGGHGRGEILGHFDEYDPTTDTWNPNGLASDGPNPRGHTGGAVTEGKMCVTGGRDDSDPDFFNKLILETDCFDLASRTWTVEANLPQGRAGLGVEPSCDGKLVAVAGEGNGRAYRDTDMFTPSGGWESGPDLNIPRHGVSLVAGSCDCGYMYLSGGARVLGGGAFTTETERLNPDPLPSSCGGGSPTSTPPITMTITSTTTQIPATTPSIDPPPTIVVDAGSQDNDMESIVSGTSNKFETSSGTQISGTQDQETFRSHRSGRLGSTFQYTFAVSGLQNVQLGFAEVWGPNCVSGRRVFSVFVNDVLQIANLDVFSAVGCNAAHFEAFQVMPDASGEVEISFQQNGGSRDPFVSLLELTPADGTPGPTTTTTTTTTPPVTTTTTTTTPPVSATTTTTTSPATTTTTNSPATTTTTNSPATTTTTSTITSTTPQNSPTTPSIDPPPTIVVDAGSQDNDMESIVSGTSNKFETSSGTQISGTQDQETFRSHRSGRLGSTFQYTFAVSGLQNVQLGFAEVWGPNCVSGRRVFSVFVNDVLQIANLDVFSAVECNAAHFEAFQVMPDASGEVEISFRQNGGSRDPFVSLLELTPADGTPGPTTTTTTTITPPVTTITTTTTLSATPPITTTTLLPTASTASITTTLPVTQDTTGPTLSFVVDAGSSSDQDGAVSGGPSGKYLESGATVTGSSDPAFKSHRYGVRGASFAYTFTVSGPSTVTLGFAEIWDPNCVPGRRVFSIFLNNARVVDSLDVFSVAGCNTAHTEQFQVTPNTNGEVEIGFRQDGGSRDPFISSITVES